MIVPKSVVAVVGFDIGCIHAYIFIISGAHDDFLAPVANDVACGRRSVLRPVAVGRSAGSEDGGSVGLEHTRCSLARRSTVECFLE